MKKKKASKLRLPESAVQMLKTRGGAHSSPKGKKGYDRKKFKKSEWTDGPLFFISSVRSK